MLQRSDEKDIGKFIGTTVVVGGCFSLILMIGFYARLAGVEVDSQDTVVREYLLFEFGGSGSDEYLLVFIFITLLAAGVSTLDGILVALSAMVVNDLVRPLMGGEGKDLLDDSRRGLIWSRWVLVAVGVIGVALAWSPPPLIGLFAQKGVYGLAAASTVPILFGVLVRGTIPLWIAYSAAVMALLIHLYLNLFGGVVNPAVSAAYAIIATVIYAALSLWLTRLLAAKG